ncbi:8928_t:CDS:2 [Ambispora leptoticha]|uniref:8928_t:CDS:1 n=1 Tax=Ambispora leptoticha TaxID=144679 RepID=A0A9N9GIN6_9GLOM|nr:8928_t:CDS:2 [Ambispora leptoticha]
MSKTRHVNKRIKEFVLPFLPKGMNSYFSSVPFVTCKIIEFLRQLDLEQNLTSAERESIHREIARSLETLRENRVLPQFARDHAKKLNKELSSKVVASFWDLILEREKHPVTMEHDCTLLQQVREKHVAISIADVVRVQRNNEADEMFTTAIENLVRILERAFVDNIWTRFNGNKLSNGSEWKTYVCRLSKPQQSSGCKVGVLPDKLRTTWKHSPIECEARIKITWFADKIQIENYKDSPTHSHLIEESDI